MPFQIHRFGFKLWEVMQGYELNLFEVYKLSEWLMNAANGIIEQNTKKVIEEK